MVFNGNWGDNVMTRMPKLREDIQFVAKFNSPSGPNVALPTSSGWTIDCNFVFTVSHTHSSS